MRHMLTAKELEKAPEDRQGWEGGSTETEKAGDKIWHQSEPAWVMGTTCSALSPFHLSLSFFLTTPSLLSSIPSQLKKHDNPLVMESLWEGLIAFLALFRCANRPLLIIITQSSYIIQASSIFQALNMSQALYLSLIVQ